MSVLWIIPLLVVAAGAAFAASAVRRTAEAAAALRAECARLEEIRVALAGLREDTDTARREVNRIWSRSEGDRARR